MGRRKGSYQPQRTASHVEAVSTPGHYEIISAATAFWVKLPLLGIQRPAVECKTQRDFAPCEEVLSVEDFFCQRTEAPYLHRFGL